MNASPPPHGTFKIKIDSKFCNSWGRASHKVVVTVWMLVWVNVCDPRECACCVSSRCFEPWWPWELRLLKFFIIVVIIIVWTKHNSEQIVGMPCLWQSDRRENSDNLCTSLNVTDARPLLRRSGLDVRHPTDNLRGWLGVNNQLSSYVSRPVPSTACS